MWVMACTSSTLENPLWANKYERKKTRFINHAHDSPAHPDLHLYQMLAKRSQRSYGVNKNV